MKRGCLFHQKTDPLAESKKKKGRQTARWQTERCVMGILKQFTRPTWIWPRQASFGATGSSLGDRSHCDNNRCFGGCLILNVVIELGCPRWLPDVVKPIKLESSKRNKIQSTKGIMIKKIGWLQEDSYSCCVN